MQVQVKLQVSIPDRRLIRTAVIIAVRLRLIKPEVAIRLYTNAVWRKARMSVGGGRWYKPQRKALAG